MRRYKGNYNDPEEINAMAKDMDEWAERRNNGEFVGHPESYPIGDLDMELEFEKERQRILDGDLWKERWENLEEEDNENEK